MSALTCSPEKASNRQHKSVRSSTHSAFITSFCPFAVASVPRQHLAVFSHWKLCFSYCSGPHVLICCCSEQSSEWWVGSMCSLWRRRALPATFPHLHNSLDCCLAEFADFSPNSPLTAAVANPQQAVHEWSPYPVCVYYMYLIKSTDIKNNNYKYFYFSRHFTGLVWIQSPSRLLFSSVFRCWTKRGRERKKEK